jgi:hypothetical protein
MMQLATFSYQPPLSCTYVGVNRCVSFTCTQVMDMSLMIDGEMIPDNTAKVTLVIKDNKLWVQNLNRLSSASHDLRGRNDFGPCYFCTSQR